MTDTASAAAIDMKTMFVPISEDRLRELEALEAGLTTRIETAVKEYKLNALKRLHERDKLNPAAVNLRAKRYAERHREEINARRRAKRAEKRATDVQARVAATLAASSPATAPSDAALHTRIVRSTLATLRRRAPSAAHSSDQTIVGAFETAAVSTTTTPALGGQPCPVGQVLVRFDL